MSSYINGRGHTVSFLRFGVGAWLLALAAYTCYRVSWFGLLFLVPSGLHFYLGCRAWQHGAS